MTQGRWLNAMLAVLMVLLVGQASRSAGIYSPTMAGWVLMPLLAFYSQGRRAGFVWLALVCLAACLVAYLTRYVWTLDSQALNATHDGASFATYAAVTFIVASVPLAYDTRFRKTYQDSLQRHQALKEKREELLRTSAQREQFIAMVSHELRTPMNAILGFNQMLLMRAQHHPEALKILNHTRQSADHLLTVINDVLDYSQMQAGKIGIQNETFALRETVDTAFQLFMQRVESTQVRYSCLINDNVPHWVHADRHRLMQILVNLIGNAIKFTHQGHVTLRVRTEPLCVHFSVSDSGIGISQQQQAKIFQRFSQANDDIQARYGGNGLGLSISQRLVELMGGHIGFHSEAGQGTQFWFTLPLVEVAPPEPPAASVTLPEAPMQTQPRFLVVDDHPINRLLLQKILINLWPRCDIVEADNGCKALAELQWQTFDLVLMDMVMPEMDGIDTTVAMRQSPLSGIQTTPVLGLTANVNQKDLARFSDAGVNAVVVKPFDATDLHAQVVRLLTAKKSSQGS
jgi:signal transduction histidine kinase